MTAIQAQARIVVTKGHIFQRRRYLMEMYIEEIYTGLHWHMTKREANKYAPIALAHASELLESFGIMDRVVAEVNALRNGQPADLPAKGSKVTLKNDVGQFTAGTEGTVTEHYWDKDVAAEHQFPIKVALIDAEGKSFEIPMALSEVEAVK